MRNTTRLYFNIQWITHICGHDIALENPSTEKAIAAIQRGIETVEFKG